MIKQMYIYIYTREIVGWESMTKDFSFIAMIEKNANGIERTRHFVRKGKRYLFQLLCFPRRDFFFFFLFVFVLISMAGFLERFSFSSPSPSSREWSIDLSATRSPCALTYYNRLGLRLVTKKRYKFYGIDIDLDPSDLDPRESSVEFPLREGEINKVNDRYATLLY